MSTTAVSNLAKLVEFAGSAGAEDSPDDDLGLLLVLSAWLRTERADLAMAKRRLEGLLGALAEVGGFDPRTEPVPLLPRDDRQAVVALVRYVVRVADRVAAVTGRERAQVVSEAVGAMGDGDRDRPARSAG